MQSLLDFSFDNLCADFIFGKWNIHIFFVKESRSCASGLNSLNASEIGIITERSYQHMSQGAT